MGKFWSQGFLNNSKLPSILGQVIYESVLHSHKNQNQDLSQGIKSLKFEASILHKIIKEPYAHDQVKQSYSWVEVKMEAKLYSIVG
jgi:hypothetical protein